MRCLRAFLTLVPMLAACGAVQDTPADHRRGCEPCLVVRRAGCRFDRQERPDLPRWGYDEALLGALQRRSQDLHPARGPQPVELSGRWLQHARAQRNGRCDDNLADDVVRYRHARGRHRRLHVRHVDRRDARVQRQRYVRARLFEYPVRERQRAPLRQVAPSSRCSPRYPLRKELLANGGESPLRFFDLNDMFPPPQ